MIGFPMKYNFKERTSNGIQFVEIRFAGGRLKNDTLFRRNFFLEGSNRFLATLPQNLTEIKIELLF